MASCCSFSTLGIPSLPHQTAEITRLLPALPDRGALAGDSTPQEPRQAEHPLLGRDLVSPSSRSRPALDPIPQPPGGGPTGGAGHGLHDAPEPLLPSSAVALTLYTLSQRTLPSAPTRRCWVRQAQEWRRRQWPPCWCSSTLPGTRTPSPVSAKLKDWAVDPKRQPHSRQASLLAQMVKSPLASAGDARNLGWIPGWGRSAGGGNGNPLQYSCLENPLDRGAWWAMVHRVAKSWTQLSNLAHNS